MTTLNKNGVFECSVDILYKDLVVDNTSEFTLSGDSSTQPIPVITMKKRNDDGSVGESEVFPLTFEQAQHLRDSLSEALDFCGK